MCKSISTSETNIDNRWMFIFSGGIIADEMKRVNKDKVIILNEKKNFFKIITVINKYCKENKIDIIAVHHGGIYINLIYMALKRKKGNIKFVRYLHSCFENEDGIKGKIYKHIFQRALTKSDLVVCVSNAVKKTHIKNLKLKEEKVTVIYNGINERFFSKKFKEEKEKNNVNLIYVGRLEKEKGLDILIDAISIIKSKHNNVNLLIVGDGSEINNLKNEVINKEVNDIVKFYGKQVDVIKWLDKSDIFIYPVVCEEAFGISVVEAMARGLVPITFNRGGLNEIINSEKDGYLVNNVNSRALSEMILKALNCDITEIRKNAIEKSKKFTIVNTIKRMEYEYKKILNK